MSNFSVLSQHNEQLLLLDLFAEKYFADDPNTCLIKLRQLAESLTQLLAARIGLNVSQEEKQNDFLRRLQDSGVLPREVHQMAKAFRAELVPQDPNDEQASELLARIQAQRKPNAANQSKRGRGRKALTS